MRQRHHSTTALHRVPPTSGGLLIGEIVLIFLALLLTLAEVSYRTLLFLLATISRLLLYSICAVLLATVFVLMYCLLLGISLTGSLGLTTNIP
jgi:hypothetical protein